VAIDAQSQTPQGHKTEKQDWTQQQGLAYLHVRWRHRVEGEAAGAQGAHRVRVNDHRTQRACSAEGEQDGPSVSWVNRCSRPDDELS
jgi:hypothetical protein